MSQPAATDRPTAPEQSGRASDDERTAIRALAASASLEIAPRDPAALGGDVLDNLPAGTDVYIAMPPGQAYYEAVAVAARLRRAGFNPVPHIPARSLASEAMLADYLARASGEAGVTQALAIGGDWPRPAGPFASALQMLASGLFERNGIRRIGIAAYPEGHPRIGADVLARELNAKYELARRADFALYLVTQFCFAAAPIMEWIERLALPLPVRVGLAGPASVTALAKFAVRCGVGNSLRTLTSRFGTIAQLVNEAGPDVVLRDLARAGLTLPSLAGVHLFSFGGFARTARWLRAVREGRFELAASGEGFRLDQ